MRDVTSRGAKAPAPRPHHAHPAERGEIRAPAIPSVPRTSCASTRREVAIVVATARARGLCPAGSFSLGAACGDVPAPGSIFCAAHRPAAGAA